jgi:hypothetical protein
MSEAAATALAAEFLSRFGETARFYTNGTFPPHDERRPAGWMGSWDPITRATFDTGVIAVDDVTVGLLWFEDED